MLRETQAEAQLKRHKLESQAIMDCTLNYPVWHTLPSLLMIWPTALLFNIVLL